ncbi:glycolate oxidase subunit GlcE [Salinarimonas chemoclinalis]|uniref:glycolate oxidase subunit GlcE n=1 Tax=Salinarimonas chemoclinalis TaxID=3241599 RepID=UPI0035569CD6
MTTHSPASEDEVRALVSDAAARAVPLSIAGGATKRGVGRPAQTQETLSTRGLTGVTLYEPAELVIAARAGTPLDEVEATLAAKNQRLAFEPADLRSLLGTEGEPTIGAVAAANLSGPRRIMVGAARDALIGVRFVNGRGEAVKNGGRVMKNVTGLDLVKTLAGSWGTLAVLTEVTFKVLPIPERTATLVYTGLDDARAIAALSAALGSPYEVTGAAHVPGEGGGAGTLIRIEGFEASVRYRLGELRALLSDWGDPALVEDADGEALWRGVRDVAPLVTPPERAVWKISTAPGRAPALAAAIAAETDARWLYDWGGGLIWLSTAADEAAARIVRAATRAHRGHATLIRAPADLRAAVDVFEPLAAPMMTMTKGLKASFDPRGIFEPGRMYAGV